MLDDDEKIRRNVVMASMGVILYWWLELPPGAITERIFGNIAKNSIDPWKVWTTIIIVLLYLCYRFYFLCKPLEELGRAKTIINGINYQSLIKHYSKESQSLKSLTDLKKLKIRESKFDVGDSGHWDQVHAFGSLTPFDFGKASPGFYAQKNDWPPILHIKYRYTANDAKVVVKTVEYRLDILPSFALLLKIIAALWKTRTMPEVIIPAVLAYVALLLSFYGLGKIASTHIFQTLLS